MKKQKTSVRHRHPIHWHGSMYLAIAAIVLATLKTGGEMAHSLKSQLPAHQVNSLASITFPREAENPHLPVILSSGIRTATLSGK